jgi:hypothetical protein
VDLFNRFTVEICAIYYHYAASLIPPLQCVDQLSQPGIRHHMALLKHCLCTMFEILDTTILECALPVVASSVRVLAHHPRLPRNHSSSHVGSRDRNYLQHRMRGLSRIPPLASSDRKRHIQVVRPASLSMAGPRSDPPALAQLPIPVALSFQSRLVRRSSFSALLAAISIHVFAVHLNNPSTRFQVFLKSAGGLLVDFGDVDFLFAPKTTMVFLMVRTRYYYADHLVGPSSVLGCGCSRNHVRNSFKES